MKSNLRLFLEIEIKTVLNSTFFQTKRPNETIHITGNFNLNLLDHDENTKVITFNLIDLIGMIAAINELTRITRKTATDLCFH